MILDILYFTSISIGRAASKTVIIYASMDLAVPDLLTLRISLLFE